MRQLTKYFLILIAFVLLSLLQGCMSSPGKKYYQLYMPADKTVSLSGEVILVEAVDIEPVYNDYRIVYRESPFELNYYSYKFWIKKPGGMVRDAIFDHFYNSNVCDRVIRSYAEGEPTLLVKAKVNVIEENDKKDAWYARLAMTIAVKSFKTGKTILTYNFNRSNKLSGKKARLVPAQISLILAEELNKMLTQLAERLKHPVK